MAITNDTPIAELKLTTQAPKNLADEGITTVGQLLAYRRSEVAAIRGMGDTRMADLDRALQVRGLWYGKPIAVHGTYPTCTACPPCETCGMPRAREAKHVVVDFLGRAKHETAPGDPCDGCDTYHRQLAANAADAAATA